MVVDIPINCSVRLLHLVPILLIYDVQNIHADTPRLRSSMLRSFRLTQFKRIRLLKSAPVFPSGSESAVRRRWRKNTDRRNPLGSEGRSCCAGVWISTGLNCVCIYCTVVYIQRCILNSDLRKIRRNVSVAFSACCILIFKLRKYLLGKMTVIVMKLR